MRFKREIPRLRLWHLIALVATVAAFLATFQFRSEAEAPGLRWIRLLRSTAEGERAGAARKLGSAWPPERRAIGPLTEALFDEAAPVRVEAADALGRILKFDGADPEAGPVIAALARGLDDPDPIARRRRVLVLAGFDVEPKLVLASLIEMAGSGDGGARREAIAALGFYARRDDRALDLVLGALGDPDPEARLYAVIALRACAIGRGEIPPDPLLSRLLDGFVRATDDPDRKVRLQAVKFLAEVSQRAGVEVPRLIEALGDPDAGIRLAAAGNLGWPRPRGSWPSAALIATLARLLDDADPSVRRAAAASIGTFGLAARSSLPTLRALKDDTLADIRAAADASIQAIQRSDLELQKGIAGLAGSEPAARAFAASQVGWLGPGASGAVPGLAKLLDDPDADARRASAEALGRIGPVASPALPGLDDRAGSDRDEDVRKAAAAAARSIRRAGAGGVPPT